MTDGRRAVPVMIYDGDCPFCRRWIRRGRRLTGNAVEYAPYQEVLDRFPQISRKSAAAAVQLVVPGGEVLSGAAAVCRTLRDVRGWGWAHRAYGKVPGFRPIAEMLYRLVARSRSVTGRVTR
jgi:predicted DCC family thiol-disulfide oxidoreductase YuxK